MSSPDSNSVPASVPLPTGGVAAVADAVAEGAMFAGKLYDFENTPANQAAALAAMNAQHLAALQAALDNNDLAALRLLLTPTS